MPLSERVEDRVRFAFREHSEGQEPHDRWGLVDEFCQRQAEELGVPPADVMVFMLTWAESCEARDRRERDPLRIQELHDKGQLTFPPDWQPLIGDVVRGKVVRSIVDWAIGGSCLTTEEWYDVTVLDVMPLPGVDTPSIRLCGPSGDAFLVSRDAFFFSDYFQPKA